MSTYNEAREAVVIAMYPVVDYCERAHQTADAADPALAGKFRHVTQLEALTNAVVDYGAAAEAIRQGYEGSERIRTFCARVRATIANIQAPPAHFQPLAGSISSHCLPIPDHARRADQEPL